jgi:hypothetical protein
MSASLTVDALAPQAGPRELQELLAGMGPGGLPPFSEPLRDLLTQFSRTLFQDPRARQYTELQALAFWMRPAEIEKLRQAHAALSAPGRILAPSGLVFHIPPGNVDTIFVYSWLLSVLAGNSNIIRLSPEADPAAVLLAEVFAHTLAQSSPELQKRNAIIRYGHDAAITGAISRVCDMRVIWGGDATIQTIRAIPAAPHAKELVFADRHSLAAFSAPAVLALDDASLADLAGRFYNDVFWFDQMACSSPKLVVWAGAGAEQASVRFWKALGDAAGRKQYTLEPGARMHKLTAAAALALQGAGAAYRQYGASVNVLTLRSLDAFSRQECGGGFFAELFAPDLNALSGWICRRDQTLVQFGFSPLELEQFSKRLAGRGIDRMVPPGEALAFHRYWDGYDLLSEFSRYTTISTAPQTK